MRRISVLLALTLSLSLPLFGCSSDDDSDTGSGSQAGSSSGGSGGSSSGGSGGSSVGGTGGSGAIGGSANAGSGGSSTTGGSAGAGGSSTAGTGGVGGSGGATNNAPPAPHINDVMPMLGALHAMWTNNDPLCDSIEGERKSETEDYVLAFTVPGEVDNKHDVAASMNTLYTYRLRCLKGGVYSEYSNEMSRNPTE